MGMAEELDLGMALNHVKRLSKDDFHSACKITLVKRAEDLEAFERAFGEYWSATPLAAPGAEDRRPRDLEPSPPSASDVQRPWGSLTRAADQAGSPGVRKVKELRLLVYSPDAPPGQRRVGLVERGELESMKRLARRFRRWAATLGGRHFEPSKRGRLDFQRTARASMRFGGELLLLRRRRRSLRRVRLVILWDVSGSMEGHGHLLLALIYSLLRAVPSAQVFAFSTALEPVTTAIRGRSYPDAAASISRKLTHARGGTRIGKCLEEFSRHYGGLVDRKTVVTVFSDGWDVGDLRLLEEQLARLSRRCHLLVWMNPYADRPDFRPEAAGMRRALPYIDLLAPLTALLDREVHRRYFRHPINPSVRRARRAEHAARVTNLNRTVPL